MRKPRAINLFASNRCRCGDRRVFFFTSSVSFCRNCNYNTLQIHLVRLDARSVRRRIFSSVFGFDLMNPFCLCMRLLTFAIYRSNGAFYVYTIN